MTLDRIEVTPFALIAGEILQHRKTGQLTIVRPPLRRILYWSQGELVMSVATEQDQSLPDFLVRRGAISAGQGAELSAGDPTMVVARVHEAGLLDLSARQSLLREWLASHFVPLFALDEGTAAFADEEPLPPEQRIFLQSTAALLVEGIRSISNGLVLRRSLGDLSREIQPARESRFSIDTLPMSDEERAIAASLTAPVTIEAFLKRFPTESVTVARIVITMLAIGIYSVVRERQPAAAPDMADMQRDLEILAALGSSDQRSLRALGFSKQIATLDHYQILDIPRAATRAQILAAADAIRARYDAATYPPILRDSVVAINRKIDEAAETLKDATRRASYDKLLHSRGGREGSLQQRMMQRTIADQNTARAKELAIQGDYYGAIVLLKQALHFVPDNADAWYLLGACQEHNPRWRRDAAESFQKALALDPNNVEALISLGDLYRSEGLSTRAQTCYEDALKISPEADQAKRRLQALKKK